MMILVLESSFKWSCLKLDQTEYNLNFYNVIDLLIEEELINI